MKFFISLITLLTVLFSNSAHSLQPQTEVKKYPVLILGGGIGSLTAATYLARGGIVPIVIEGQQSGGALAQSPSVQNWPGEIDVPGWEITDKVRKQAESNGAQILKQEVIGVDFSKRPFTITTRDLVTGDILHYKAESCIIGLGSSPQHLNIPGEQEYWLKGVYHCAVCDGSFFKGQVVGIVGGGDTAVLDAEYLSKIAKKVHVFVRKDGFRGMEKNREETLLSKDNVEVHFNTTLQEIKGNGSKLTSVIASEEGENQRIELDGLFLAIGSRPNSELFRGQLDLDKKGYIIAKDQVQTSVKGVYAIGDIADPFFQQAVSAAGDGAKAALLAHHYVTNIKAENAVSEQIAKPAPESEGVVEITSLAEFRRELKKSPSTVFVDFYATWCGPCRTLAPIFEQLAKKSEGKARFFKVNVDVAEEMSQVYGISAMPTMIAFDSQGKEITRRTGTYEISGYISSYLKQNP
jgi:thioredoxin reductase (NADPH)